MKASLPFKFINAVKGGKYYVVFDYKDEEGKRKRTGQSWNWRCQEQQRLKIHKTAPVRDL